MYFDLNRRIDFKKRQLVIGLASLVLVSGLVATPLASLGAKGKASVEAPAAPEAGVELLESILHRIGNETQIAEANKKKQTIAMAPPAEADSFAPSQQGNFNQAIDPAYVIRPPQRAEKAKRSRSSIDGLQIASSAKISSDLSGMRRNTMSNAGAPVGGKFADQEFGATSAMESIGGSARAGAGGSGRGMAQLGRDAGKLGSLLNKMQNVQQQAQSGMWDRQVVGSAGDNFYLDGAAPGAPASKNVREVVPISASRGYQSKDGRITDWKTQSAAERKAEGLASSGFGKSISASGAVSEPMDEEESRDSSSMKLDKPNAFRNDQIMKEYYAEPTADKASTVTKPLPMESKSLGEKSRAKKTLIAQRPANIAFIPPSLVAGIPQLKLGANASEAASFMATHGKFKSKAINGWKVWSLTNAETGQTDLQIFMRGGSVEGFRIFNPAFVPERLGVNLSGTLADVKGKFGEPAFWMWEPALGKEKNIKNLVYPVNQVSFQMARTGGKDNKAVVQSLLMFKFL